MKGSVANQQDFKVQYNTKAEGRYHYTNVLVCLPILIEIFQILFQNIFMKNIRLHPIISFAN